ncbi:MAG: RapZ C-terminal domain-containing protein, partial [Acetobacteraceae bacterium]
GIAAEAALTAPLRAAADVVIDTSELPIAALRRLVEARFAAGAEAAPAIALVSFAYPAGLPREADLVLDARFLRNPFYDPELRARTGMDPEVAEFIESDPDFARYRGMIGDMLGLLLPRFVQEGKKYVTIAIGCSGGRHRSVHLVETLASYLAASGWRVSVTHRELSRDGASETAPRAGLAPASR